MTKKNYIRAAELIREEHRFQDISVKELVADTFANFFQEENERFNRQRFLEACGVVGRR